MPACDLCKGSGEFNIGTAQNPDFPIEECAVCGGAGVRQPRRRTWTFRGVSVPAIRFQLIHRDDARLAPLDVLKRRDYMRVIVLPFRRLFIISWLDL